jgi:hypothetical protein
MSEAVAQLIHRIEDAGGWLALAGERIRYRLPRTMPDPEGTLAALRSNREQVIRLLRERQGAALCGSPHCARCYEVEPGRRIHPPRASRDWLAWLEQWQPKGPNQ